MKLDDADPADLAAASFRPQKAGIIAYQLWQVHRQKLRQIIWKEYLHHWEATASETWTGWPVDAIICPAAPFSARPHGKNRYADYTTVWNVLDYPAAIFPVTAVDSIVDGLEGASSWFLSRFDKHIYEMYHPGKFKDAPICLRLVGWALEEEAVILK